VRTAVALSKLIETRFPRWDSNHDGSLDVQEVNAQIESVSVRGPEAALMVAIFRQLLGGGKGDHSSVTRQELLQAAGDAKFAKAVQNLSRKVTTLDRRLFLDGDPNLVSFHQGRVGDCYLLAAIAAAVNRDPQAVRSMIHPAKNNEFEVVFGDGQVIHAPAVTDGELLLGSRVDRTHGIWLTVLEKAFGIIRARNKAKKSGKPRDAQPVVPEELIGGGDPAQIISLLTGHKTKRARSSDTAQAKPKGPVPLSAQQFHELLARLVRDRRLICTGIGKDKKRPPGIVGGHIYAVLDYDVANRRVKVFNPWGQTFNPKGAPGLANGYATAHGQFDVPLDEFRTVFGGVCYETTEPLHSSKSKSVRN
jgi:hypothetical protein